MDGDKTVSIFGERINVEAEIHNFTGFSGHADKENLLEWVGGLQRPPHEIFLVHGEADAKKNLAEAIREIYGYQCIDVQQVSEYTLSKDGAVTREDIETRLVSPESIWAIKKKLYNVHDELVKVLYNTQLAITGLSPEQVAEISNLILEIEKNILNLGSAVTREGDPYVQRGRDLLKDNKNILKVCEV
ncbi:MAG: MBL fold metallo-hydrolase RNA specificity domain-containing protein [Anaerovoracaceae bacterium]